MKATHKTVSLAVAAGLIANFYKNHAGTEIVRVAITPSRIQEHYNITITYIKS